MDPRLRPAGMTEKRRWIPADYRWGWRVGDGCPPTTCGDDGLV